MALTRVQIQAKSDQKRGVKVKGFKLHADDIAFIEQASKDLNISQAKLIVDAVKYYVENKAS
ncbi:hypothetical protein RCS94_06525 [Orbaceae bacterium ac157xtp]